MDAREHIASIAREKREQLVGGGDDFRGLLRRMITIWPDPSHCLIELLQNADDCKATSVTMEVTEAGILFRHNGKRFSRKEVKALCSIDQSTKDAEQHTGFMGIGFKSVFRVSRSPTVLAPPYLFRFPGEDADPSDWGWILTPEWVEEGSLDVPHPAHKTTFWLPFFANMPDHARDRVNWALLSGFDSISLLFLRHVRKIRFATEESVRVIRRTKQMILEERDGDETVHHYHLVRRPFTVPKWLREDPALEESSRETARVRDVALVFLLDEKKNLTPAPDLPLYNYLPTDYRPGLKFVVQADFILDTPRTDIQEGLEWNAWLWQCVFKTFRGAINGFTENGTWTPGFRHHSPHKYQFYGILPSRDDFDEDTQNRLIYKEFLEPLWGALQDSAIVITSQGKWARPADCAIAEKSFRSFVDEKQLEAVFGRRQYVHRRVRRGRDVLRQLGAAAIEEGQLLKTLTDRAWLKTKPPGWFDRLYTLLLEKVYERHSWSYHGAWSAVEEASVVLAENGTPFGVREVLLPPQGSRWAALRKMRVAGIRYVHPKVRAGAARKFLEEFGVKRFSLESVIDGVVLEAFENGDPASWPRSRLEKYHSLLREWLTSRSWRPPEQFVPRLSRVQVMTEAGSLEEAGKCFFPTDRLRSLYPEGPFVRAINGAERQFLAALGVAGRPRVVSGDFYQYFSDVSLAPRWKEYWAWCRPSLEYPYSSGISLKTLERFDEITWTKQSAASLLSFLLEHWRGYAEHFTAPYWYVPRSIKHHGKFSSYLQFELLRTEWLPTNRGLVEPSDDVFVPMPQLQTEEWGQLLTFLALPESVPAEHVGALGTELGLTTELDVEALARILAKLEPLPFDDATRGFLSHVYLLLGELLGREPDAELPELSLPTTNGKYAPADSLYWIDDPNLGAVLDDADGPAFAWLPRGIPKPPVERLLERAQVRRLTDHLERRLVEPAKVARGAELERVLRERAQFLISLAGHLGSDSSSDLPRLDEISVYRTERLQVVLLIDDITRVMDAPAFFDVAENVLYVATESYDKVALELCRGLRLDLGLPVLSTALVLKSTPEEIEDQFASQGISLLDLKFKPLPPLSGPKPESELSEAVEAEEEARRGEPEVTTEPGKDRPRGRPRTYGPREPRRTGAHTVHRPPLPYEERMRREGASINEVKRFEDNRGYDCDDVRDQYMGYDIVATHRMSGDRRFIEVKSPSAVQLTRNEHETASELNEQYFVYVVGERSLRVISDPCSTCDVREISVMDTRFALDDWTEHGEEFPLD